MISKGVSEKVIPHVLDPFVNGGKDIGTHLPDISDILSPETSLEEISREVLNRQVWRKGEENASIAFACGLGSVFT